MQTKSKRTDQFLLTLVAGMIPVTIVLGNYFDMSVAAIVTIVMVASLIFGWLLMWIHANQHATGQEWWQDNDCSGWRGY